MKLEFTARAMNDYEYWKSHHPGKAARIKALLENVLAAPFTGIGKPEPLTSNLQGYWSRRIDRQHRLVYTMDGDRVIVVACRYHYTK